jgi:basic amino acid/polyamine antiporter, APA family
VERPERTISRAIVAAMVIVIAFYLLTNLALVASLDQETLQSSPSSLMDATQALFPGAEVLVLLVGMGALLSILGADESGTLGTSRLAYAMTLDGLLPHQLAKKHPRFDTPRVAILALGGVAFLVLLVGGLAALFSSAVLYCPSYICSPAWQGWCCYEGTPGKG